MKSTRMDTLKPYLYIAPGFLFLFVFVYYPIGFSIYGSLFRWRGTARQRFVRFENYAYLLDDPDFIRSLWITLLYVAIVALGSVVLGFLAANLVCGDGTQSVRGQGFFNATIFSPHLMPWVAAGMIWLWLLHPNYGFVNRLFNANIDWVRNANYALWAIIVVTIWRNMGYYYLLFLTGLQNISVEYYEAAKLDGVRWHQRLRYITIPLLGPTIFYVGIISIVYTLQAIDLVYIMTSGGPARSTNVLLYYIYEKAFVFLYWDLGLTASVVLFAFLLLITVLYFVVLERRVHYES